MADIKFEMHLFGTDSRRLNKKSKGVQLLNQRLNTMSKKLKDVPVTAALDSGKSINQLSESFRKVYEDGLKKSFINTPQGWVSLGSNAQEIRRMLKDPSYLATKIKTLKFMQPKKSARMFLFSDGDLNSEISKVLSLTNKKTKRNQSQIDSYKSDKEVDLKTLHKRIDDFCNSLNPPVLHPRFGITKPPLLNTGNLMESIKVKLESNSSRSKEGIIREKDFFVSYASYGNKYFLGKSFVVPKLVITSKASGASAYLFIPMQFSRKLKRLNLDPLFDVDVVSENIRVPARNPFVLNRKMMQELNKFEINAWKPFSRAAQAKLLELQGLI